MEPAPSSRRTPASPVATTRARERFEGSDRYRVGREWQRYEGTAQRDLFRSLREAFLVRHFRPTGWALDLGSGPGRFTPWLTPAGSGTVAMDLSRVALEVLDEKWPRGRTPEAVPDRVRGDGARPPFRPESFGCVAVLGNTLGFAGPESDALLSAAESLIAPGGRLLVEIAPGPGERSSYLARLPPSSVARLLRSPVRAVLPRVEREGFHREPRRRASDRDFRRYAATSLVDRWTGRGWTVLETLAVAPALGPDSLRAAAVRADPKAWAHLLVLEETLGREPHRQTDAAAVLLAAERGSKGA